MPAEDKGRYWAIVPVSDEIRISGCGWGGLNIIMKLYRSTMAGGAFLKLVKDYWTSFQDQMVCVIQ